MCYQIAQGTQEPVTVEYRSKAGLPEWLSGTLARHACGVYGETGDISQEYLLL